MFFLLSTFYFLFAMIATHPCRMKWSKSFHLEECLLLYGAVFFEHIFYHSLYRFSDKLLKALQSDSTCKLLRIS